MLKTSSNINAKELRSVSSRSGSFSKGSLVRKHDRQNQRTQEKVGNKRRQKKMPSYTTNSGEVVSRFLSRMSASKGCASAFRVFAKKTYGTPRESNARNMNNKISKGASCTEMRVLGLKISLGARVMSMGKY